MFHKNFSIKKNAAIRASDAKRLLKRIPVTKNGDNLNKKSSVAQIKVITANGVALNVYAFDKNPLFFDFDAEGTIFPTIYYTWLAPKTFPVLIVHDNVYRYLLNGADLMMQGIVQHHKLPIPVFPKGAAIGISLLGSGKVTGPIAIGQALMSSADMVKSKFNGKGVEILHILNDCLWEFGLRSNPPSKTMTTTIKDIEEASVPEPHSMGYEDMTRSASGDPSKPDDRIETLPSGSSDAVVDFSSLSISDVPQDSADNTTSSPLRCGSSDDSGSKSSDVFDSEPMPPAPPIPEDPSETMEELLLRCYLAGLKYRLKKCGGLPMDVGQFYANCLLACVPDGGRLDMKKTRYKKFGVFIDYVNKMDLTAGDVVVLQKGGKGDLLVDVNFSHPLLSNFKATNEKTTDPGEAPLPTSKVTEYISVTEPVMILMKPLGIRRGDLLDVKQVRELITQHVKAEKLDVGKMIKMDPVLAGITKINTETSDWNTVMQKVINQMTKTFVIEFPDGRQVQRKVSVPKIVFKVEVRSGKKKVTLVNNLAVFGIDPKTICSEIQVGVATSAVITGDAPQCEGPQILIQGNQVAFIGEHLMNQYGIERKYIEGLELAPKKKK